MPVNVISISNTHVQRFHYVKNLKNKRYESIAEEINVPYGTPYLKKNKDF